MKCMGHLVDKITYVIAFCSHFITRVNEINFGCIHNKVSVCGCLLFTISFCYFFSRSNARNFFSVLHKNWMNCVKVNFHGYFCTIQIKCTRMHNIYTTQYSRYRLLLLYEPDAGFTLKLNSLHGNPLLLSKNKKREKPTNRCMKWVFYAFNLLCT